ncbi:MAG TPA: hypothetical protein VNW92_26905 [Polyangiaceae bacterium]|jgi:hypothetical protein|nr:hypothetical protein [Polyangiaceae bacterium]
MVARSGSISLDCGWALKASLNWLIRADAAEEKAAARSLFSLDVRQHGAFGLAAHDDARQRCMARVRLQVSPAAPARLGTYFDGKIEVVPIRTASVMRSNSTFLIFFLTRMSRTLAVTIIIGLLFGEKKSDPSQVETSKKNPFR